MTEKIDKESPSVVGHDSPLDQKCRIYASMSFAVLLLAIGLPLWWQTTAVQRVTLPYSGIKDLDELKLMINLKVYVGCLDAQRCEALAIDILNRVTENRQSDIFKMTVSHFGLKNTSIIKAKTIADLDKAILGFNLTYGDLLILEAKPEVLNNQLVHVSSDRAVYFSSGAEDHVLGQVLRDWIYRPDALRLTRDALAEPTEYTLDIENRRRFPASLDYDVLLTIVNPEPDEINVDRKLTLIAQAHIEPFLNELKPVANFTMKTQWLYLLPLGVKPKQVPNASKSGRHYALPEDLLPQIITPFEKKLASQVSLHPTINLVSYIVPCNGAPLHIYTRTGRRLTKDKDFEAFLSPRWGGIALVNPPADFCERAKEGEIFTPSHETTTGVFLAQLRLLIGITDKPEMNGVVMSPLKKSKLRSWEIDDLMRIRSVEHLTSAKLTLQSLARLLREISNIVITEQVGELINHALRYIQLSTKLLEDGKFLDGFLASKMAFIMAEEAFSDPSLLALLYFPDDQKYAVYIPLFLPVMIPVLFSLKNIKNYLFCSD